MGGRYEKRSGSSRAAVEGAVLDYVSGESYRPATVREIVRRLRAPDEERATVRRIVRGMIRDGRLVRIAGRRVVAGGPEGTLVGVLERRPDGRTVVTGVHGGDPVEIGPRDRGDAREGDTVAVRRLGPARPGARSHGAVVRVVLRERAGRFGLLTRRGRAWEIRPFDPEDPAPAVPAAFRHGANEGDAVRYAALPGSRGRGEARVLEVLGPIEAPGVDVEIVCRRHGLRTSFPAGATSEAASLPDAIPAAEVRRRERFDDPAPVTIDGADARDFDDAIAVRPLAGGAFRLFVHVADVSWFVRPGSALDREAAARGTSTYFPDRVVPMLPPRLSDDLCSLRPDSDRLVQSVVVDVGPKGRILRYRIRDGVIRSAARLTYDGVAAALDGRDPAAVPADVRAMLRDADRLREILEETRRRRGSIDLDLPEPRIQVDLDGVMTGVTLAPRNRAHRMIEAFMLLANEVVADDLERRGFDLPFRVHEIPDPAKIEALGEFVRKFGIDWKVDPHSARPKDLQRLLSRLESSKEYPIVAQVALRSMKQARYAIENVGHFGLAADAYTHFTSPIRRYPDLVVHRIARSVRDGEAPAPTVDPLADVAVESSRLERNAEAAERELVEWKKVRFLRDRVGETFEGIVTGVAAFGLFVRLTDSLVEGLLHVRALGPDRYDFDEGRLELRGRHGGEAFALGDRLRVRVDRVDLALRRVELSPEGRTRAPSPRKRRSRRRRPPS